MLQIDQKYKDLYNSYGGKSIRLIFFKDNFRALYPSETLYPSEQLYPSEMDKDSIAFEITDDMVHADTLVITESLCSEENLDFGACESAQMEIVVSNPPQNIAGLEFMLVISFAGFDLIRGIYIVDSTPRENDRNTRRIIAYDRMHKFDHDVSGWYKTEKFPTTLKAFRQSLCAFVGVPEIANVSLVNDDMVVEKTINPTSLLGRDVLRYICQINGVFANMDLIGELRYVSIPHKDNITDTITIYKSVESEEYTVPDIDTIKIQKEEGDIGGVSSGGDDMNVYIVEGNVLVYGKTTSQQNEIADKILSVASNLEYRPATIEINGSPWYEMGDRIRVKTSDGDVDTIIMRRVSTGIQGVMDTIESTGSDELKRVFSVRTQILEAKGLTAILKRTVEEVSNELRNFETNTETNFTQTAELIRLEAKRAESAESQLSSSITQQADRITQEVTRATKEEGTLSAKIEVNAKAITQRVTTSQAESLIEQKADSIRLKANEISWSSKNSSMTKDGKFSCKDGTFSGKITASSGKIGAFDIDADGSLSASTDKVHVYFGEVSMDNTGLQTGNWWISNDEIVGFDCGTLATQLGSLFVYGSKFYEGWTVGAALDDLRNKIDAGGGQCPQYDCEELDTCPRDESACTRDEPGCGRDYPSCSHDSSCGECSLSCSGDCSCYGPGDS